MYLPGHFDEKDQTRVRQLIKDYPFATLLNIHDGEPVINHLPIILYETDSDLKLLGHMSKQNPQSTSIQNGEQVTVIFHGPHTYITPKWYAENDVPTWNYAVTHVTGRLRWIDGFKPLVALLQKMTKEFESNSEESWKFFIPDDLKNEADLTSAIIGFEIEAVSIQAKFKLSQNRSLKDREGVIRGLDSRSDDMSRKIQKMMRDSK